MSLSAKSSEQSTSQEAEAEGQFQALIPAIVWRLQRDRRITYRTLEYTFGLDKMLLGEIREELLLIGVACDEGGKVLVWTGEALAPDPSTR